MAVLSVNKHFHFDGEKKNFSFLLADKTSNRLGVNEMLIASSVNGFLFGFVSGQPLLILGPTGPFLVFEEMVYDVSEIRMIMKYKSIYLAMSIIERRFLDSPMLC